MKNANPSMSVCEVGASIGRLWREMSDTDKQQYNDDFSREKADFTIHHLIAIFFVFRLICLMSMSETAVTDNLQVHSDKSLMMLFEFVVKLHNKNFCFLYHFFFIKQYCSLFIVFCSHCKKRDIKAIEI